MRPLKTSRWLLKNALDMMFLCRNVNRFHQYREEFVGNGYISDKPWEELKRFTHFPPKSLFKLLFPKRARGAFYSYCGMMQDEREFEMLYKILKSIKPQRALEIGTADGGTLFCLAHIVAERLISIDLPKGIHGGGYTKYRKDFYQNFEGLLPRLKLNLIRGDSTEITTIDRVSEILRNNKLDILFIDGDHTLEGVRCDFFNYRPFVRSGGLIVFHDITADWIDDLEVGLFWRELKGKNPTKCTEIKINPLMGIGILEV